MPVGRPTLPLSTLEWPAAQQKSTPDQWAASVCELLSSVTRSNWWHLAAASTATIRASGRRAPNTNRLAHRWEARTKHVGRQRRAVIHLPSVCLLPIHTLVAAD